MTEMTTNGDLSSRMACSCLYVGSSVVLSGDFMAASMRPASSCSDLGSCARPELKAARASACLPRHCRATPCR